MVAKLATQKDRSKYLTGLSAGVYQPNTTEYQDVVSVISQHACFAEKSAAGMVAIRVGYHPEFKRYKVVYIQHPDGTSTDIKFTKSYPKAHAKAAVDMKCALRTAIKDQVIEYKHAAFNTAVGLLHCAQCKCELQWCDTQVDHVVKFRDLYSGFLKEHGQHKHPLTDNRASGVMYSENDETYV